MTSSTHSASTTRIILLMMILLNFSALQAASPSVASPTVTNISATSATLIGDVTADGGTAVTERGVVYAALTANIDPIIGGAEVTQVTAAGTTGVFTAALTGLTEGSVYGYKVYATNGHGTTYSVLGTFTVGAVGTLPGNLQSTFSPDIDGAVISLVVQADGKMLIGGNFTSVGGVARNYVARLNADGTLDSSFNPDADGSVVSLAVQADGKVLIGGFFNTVGGVTQKYVARLNADGTLDTSFLNTDADGFVYSLAVQADGRVLIGGDFTTMNDEDVTRNFVARLNTDGTVDNSFNPNANSTVYSLAIQADGKVLLGGEFTTIGGLARNYVARLNANGTVDGSFNPDANGGVYSLAVQADGKVLIGGNLTAVGGVERSYVARLNADSTLDTSFNPHANGSVVSLALQADGKVLLAGNFTTVGSVARNYIARLTADGAVDTSFNPHLNSFAYSLALQADGKVLIGGAFATVGSVARKFVARLINDTAPQSLSSPDATQVLWSRSGAAAEISAVTFESSTDNGATWILLGAGARVGSSANWQLTGLSLGADAKLRATGSYQNGSSGLVRQVYPAVGIGSLGSMSVCTTTARLCATTTVDDLLAVVTKRGFVYAPTASNSDPLIGGASVTKVSVVGATGAYNSSLRGLTASTDYTYKAYVESSEGIRYTKTATFTTLSVPTNITLSPDSLAENNADNATVGTFSATDADVGQSHTFSLVSGTGDTDNASFTIDGTTLKINSSADFEMKNSYSIRVLTDDGAGGVFAKVMAVTITDVNEAPTAIALTQKGIAEINAPNATVGTLSATDVDTGDTHTFSLVSGSGDADNASVTLSDSTLKLIPVADFETKSSYSIRVQADDGKGGVFAQALIISITDVPGEGTLKPLAVSLLPSSAAGALTFSPSLSSTGMAVVGRTYTVTATAKTGFFFDSWSGGKTTGTSVSTTFTFAGSDTVVANFTSTPFTSSVAGKYNSSVIGTTAAASGLFSTTLGLTTGTLSARLNTLGTNVAFNGRFDFRTLKFISPTVVNGHVADLTLNPTTKRVSGTITEMTGGVVGTVHVIDAPKTYDRTTPPTTGVGVYNAAFSSPVSLGTLIAAQHPHGNGYGVLSIGTTGTVIVSGLLADGTAWSSSASLGIDQSIPLYAVILTNRGAMVGTATLDTSAVATDLTGSGIKWFSSARSTQYYPAGYEGGLSMGLVGALRSTSTRAALGLSGTPTVVFSGGPFASPLSVGLNGTLLSTDKLTKLTFSANGLMTGEYKTGSTAVKHVIKGIIVGKGGTAEAYGYILSPLPAVIDGTGQGGRVELNP
jgi:uncharacterized delta-60 repeat protein